jgi:hypothetical protein
VKRVGRRCSRSWISLSLALGVSSLARGASADVCPVPQGAEAIAAVDREERLAYLARAFDREVSDIDQWSWTWGGVYAAGAVAQAAALPFTSDHGKRIDLYVGVASTSFGALTLTALPLQLTVPLRLARGHFAEADRCAALARAERTLFKVEKDQRLATSWVGHVGNILVNVGIGLILGLGYDRWSSAALSAGVGIAVGEANAFTQPHHLRDVIERYRSGRFDLMAPRMTWAVVPIAGPQMSGAAVRVSW